MSNDLTFLDNPVNQKESPLPYLLLFHTPEYLWNKWLYFYQGF